MAERNQTWRNVGKSCWFTTPKWRHWRMRMDVKSRTEKMWIKFVGRHEPARVICRYPRTSNSHRQTVSSRYALSVSFSRYLAHHSSSSKDSKTVLLHESGNKPEFTRCSWELLLIGLKGFLMDSSRECKLDFKETTTQWITFSLWTNWWNA